MLKLQQNEYITGTYIQIIIYLYSRMRFDGRILCCLSMFHSFITHSFAKLSKIVSDVEYQWLQHTTRNSRLSTNRLPKQTIQFSFHHIILHKQMNNVQSVSYIQQTHKYTRISVTPFKWFYYSLYTTVISVLVSIRMRK